MRQQRIVPLAAIAVIGVAVAGVAGAQGRERARDVAADQDRTQQSTQDRDQDRLADRDRVLDRDQDRALDRDRDRDRDQDRDQDRDRDRDQLHVQDREQLRDRDIYASELMSAEERNEYRNRLRQIATEQEWVRFRAEHQARMVARARERGVALPPPLYGQQLMTDRERARLRERLEKAATEQERERIRTEHRTEMQERARGLGVPAADLGQ
jgi:hypothetical protein